MQTFSYSNKNSQQILALGPESNGNFSVFKNGRIFFSEDFGDLLLDENFSRFKKELNAFLKKEQITPNVVLTDLHPLYKTTEFGKNLAKKYKAQHIQIQHHLAHIFSQVGNDVFQDTRYKIQDTNTLPTGRQESQITNLKYQNFFGIALDGTGYGLDGKIWGGEIFLISNFKFQISNQIPNLKLQIQRIGHLEDQVMIGGDLAIREPARMLISILDKITRNKIQDTKKSQISNLKSQKEFIYNFVKKYYSQQEFEVLYNQLQQNFNCVETSSTGRVLDAVSLLLGFCGNERNYKHEAIFELEANSTKPYLDIKPKIDIIDSNLISNFKFQISNEIPMTKCQNKYPILNTTFLFKYLIKNLHKDKKRLAATAQLYIAQGLAEIIKLQDTKYKLQNTTLAGGISNNKIISKYFENKKTGSSSKIPVVQIPRGDAGLSFGQIIYFLSTQ